MVQTIRNCLLGLIVIFPFVSFSQEDSVVRHASKPTGLNTFFISFGTWTPDFLLDGYEPGRPTEYSYANKGNPGALCITYKYRFSKRAYIGITGTLEQQYGDWLDNEILDGNVFDLQTTVKGAFVRTCYTLAAEFSWDYASRDLYRLYTVMGLGFTAERETDQYDIAYYEQGYNNGINKYGPIRQDNNHTHVNGYYAPLGISIGRKLSYFLELGFGYKGIVHTGLSYRF